MKLRQTALGGISNHALASGDLPERIKFLNWGRNPSDRGDFLVDEQSVQALNAQIARGSFARIVLDFEHNSLKGSPHYQPPPRQHAAYGTLKVIAPHHAQQALQSASSGVSANGDGAAAKGLAALPTEADGGQGLAALPGETDVPEDAVVRQSRTPTGSGQPAVAACDAAPAGSEAGVWLENLEWTESGRKYAREYADISPALQHDAQRRVLGVISVALCPNGSLRDVTFFSADSNQEDNMPDDTDVTKLMEQIAALNTALQAVTQDLQAVKNENTALRKWVDEQGAELRKAQENASAIAGLTARADELAAGQETLQKQALLTSACAAGKAVALTDEAIAKLSLQDLEQHVAALAATVPLSRQTPVDAGTPAGNDRVARQSAAVSALQAELKTTFELAWETARKRHPELF